MSPHLMRFWFESFEAAVDASMIVQRRVTLITEAAASGRLLGEPERWRMGPEKMAALTSGLLAGSMTAASEMQRAVLDPRRLSSSAAKVARAATAPARRTVRANAKRLVHRPAK